MIHFIHDIICLASDVVRMSRTWPWQLVHRLHLTVRASEPYWRLATVTSSVDSMSSLLCSSRAIATTRLRWTPSSHFRSFSISRSHGQKKRNSQPSGTSRLHEKIYGYSVGKVGELNRDARIKHNEWQNEMEAMLRKVQRTEDPVERKRLQADMAVVHARAMFLHPAVAYLNQHSWMSPGASGEEFWLGRKKALSQGADAIKPLDAWMLLKVKSLLPTLFARSGGEVDAFDRIGRLCTTAGVVLVVWPVIRLPLTALRWYSKRS